MKKILNWRVILSYKIDILYIIIEDYDAVPNEYDLENSNSLHRFWPLEEAQLAILATDGINTTFP